MLGTFRGQSPLTVQDLNINPPHCLPYKLKLKCEKLELIRQYSCWYFVFLLITDLLGNVSIFKGEIPSLLGVK